MQAVRANAATNGMHFARQGVFAPVAFRPWPMNTSRGNTAHVVSWAGVSFSATAGVINGTLTFTDSASNGPQTVSLTGAGSTVATASPTSLNFGSVKVGHTSSAKTVTLTNTGGASFTFSSITVTASFAISSNTCGASLAPGANCTVSVTFTPAAKGAINGTLTFTDSALNSPQVVSLTGSGQ